MGILSGIKKRAEESRAKGAERAAFRAEVKAESKGKAKAAYKRAYVSESAKAAARQGRRDVYNTQGGFGSGVLGGLEKFSDYSAKIAPNIDEFYGGTPRKGKKRKAGDEFGAFAI